MSPSTLVTRWSTSAARSRSSIAALTSMPVTSWPPAASGIASRPVPTASSRIRAGRPATSESRNATVAGDVADVAEPLVVDVGDPLAVRLGAVPLHRRTLMRGGPPPG